MFDFQYLSQVLLRRLHLDMSKRNTLDTSSTAEGMGSSCNPDMIDIVAWWLLHGLSSLKEKKNVEWNWILWYTEIYNIL